MNNCSLLGRITKDIELKQSASNMAYCRFTLAVNRKVKKEGQPDADFISCKAFGKTAEMLAKYLGKGRQIAVTGHIQTGSYDKDDGTKVYTTDIMVDGITFADSKPAGQAPATTNPDSEPTDPLASSDELPFQEGYYV